MSEIFCITDHSEPMTARFLSVVLRRVLAKLAAPGACNPDDQTPVVDDTPDADAVRRDTRSQAQRHHDGLLAGLRGLLASGELGQHRGLPVTVVVSTTLKELEAATGKGVTGGGSRVPIAGGRHQRVARTKSLMPQTV